MKHSNVIDVVTFGYQINILIRIHLQHAVSVNLLIGIEEPRINKYNIYLRLSLYLFLVYIMSILELKEGNEKYKDTVCFICNKQANKIAGSRKGAPQTSEGEESKTTLYTIYYSCEEHIEKVYSLAKQHMLLIRQYDQRRKRYEECLEECNGDNNDDFKNKWSDIHWNHDIFSDVFYNDELPRHIKQEQNCDKGNHKLFQIPLKGAENKYNCSICKRTIIQK